MRVVIVVPPFADINRPSLAAHLLQACARQGSFEVIVIYGNLQVAALIGEQLHHRMSYTSASTLIGERMFARAAYRVNPFGQHFDAETALAAGFDYDILVKSERICNEWVNGLAKRINALKPDIVGCTTTFEQTAGAMAILRAIKDSKPQTCTIIGGANCEGEMAMGIALLGKGFVDHVFSGESEQTFPEFLRIFSLGQASERIVRGKPCRELDSLPTPDYQEYFDQLAQELPDPQTATRDSIWIPYESSRGCWWGEKHHCTFCGINGEGMAYREKRASKVVEELRRYSDDEHVTNICMVDNIMPHGYFSTVLPALAKELPGKFHIFYEQKANLNLLRMQTLRAAGVNLIQPGIEALSTPLLKLMKKGVDAKQNVNLLRLARSVGVAVNWNLLWGFPGDSAEWYASVSRLLPLLRHLNPPTGLWPLSIERFSPYFFDAKEYGVHDVSPIPSYADVVPGHVDPAAIAYHFRAAYSSGSYENPGVIQALNSEVFAWKAAWNCIDEATSATSSDSTCKIPDGAPLLGLAELGDNLYLLLDTRQLPNSEPVQFLQTAQVEILLRHHSFNRCTCDTNWAIERGLLAPVDNEWIPLATAEPDLLQRFQGLGSAGCIQEANPLRVISTSAA